MPSTETIMAHTEFTLRIKQSHPYAGRPIAFLTQHGKEQVVSPILNKALGCQIERVSGFNTDELGTFTRDIPRYGTQLDAARRKARIGMELSGLDLGLASEGSFGSDPHTGLFPWNIEILLLIDDTRNIEVVGIHQGPASSDHAWIADWPELEAFAHHVGFPRQHLVLRPCGENDLRLRKGLADWPSLKTAFAWAKKLSSDDPRIFVERDLRANAHPERMINIGKATQNLAEKLCSFCPECTAPGYSAVETVVGLPCMKCGQPTQESKGAIWGCQACGFREEYRRNKGIAFADPAHCDGCNP